MGKLIHLDDYRKPEEDYLSKFTAHDIAMKHLDDTLREHDRQTTNYLRTGVYFILGAGCAFLVSSIASGEDSLNEFVLYCCGFDAVLLGMHSIHKSTEYKGQFRKHIRNKEIYDEE